MPFDSFDSALGRMRSWVSGQHRELACRLAYLQQRREELARHPAAPLPGVLGELDERLEDIRLDLVAWRDERAATALNDLDELVATIEEDMREALIEQQAHADRVARLQRNLASSRARLAGLRLAGVGSDGLGILEARLARAGHGHTPAAIAAAEAEAAAVERSLDRLTERTARGHKIP